MSAVELLADLRDRIARGVMNLDSLLPGSEPRDRKRIEGKIQGLRLVEDWLRSYDEVGS